MGQGSGRGGSSRVLLGHEGLGLGHRPLPQACPGPTRASLEPSHVSMGASGSPGGGCGGTFLAGVGGAERGSASVGSQLRQQAFGLGARVGCAVPGDPATCGWQAG